MLDFEHVNVFIVGRCIDQQRRLQLFGVPGGRTALVFACVLFGSLAELIGRGIKVAIALALITGRDAPARLQITTSLSAKTDGAGWQP